MINGQLASTFVCGKGLDCVTYGSMGNQGQMPNNIYYIKALKLIEFKTIYRPNNLNYYR